MQKLFEGIKAILINIGRPILAVIKFLFSRNGGFLVSGLVLLAMGGAVVWFYNSIWKELPDVNNIKDPPVLSSTILDRDGNLLYKFYLDENRTWIPIEKVPLSLIWATIAIEDKGFFNHHGLSFRGVGQAILYDLRINDDSGLRGGSTITQQLAKNVFLSNEKTFKRKIKELVLAVMLEWKLNKYQILERYFNQVAYGGETYGVQEAANKLFGKNVWELNMAESTFLAGLPAAPSSYSPYGNNSEYAFARQRRVIEEMVSAGFVSQGKAEELKNQKIEIKSNTKYIRNPHFVFYVKEELEKMGYKDFEREGLTIKTSLDQRIQDVTQNIVKTEVDQVKNLRISNGAALVIDVRNGDILAMVGSKDYYAKDIDGKYNVVTAERQPGSSIKPINYVAALHKGWTISSVLEDTPISYPVKGQKPYTPQNYNGRYMGRVTLKTALASSLNIPSVKLLNEYGVDTMIDQGEKMGITTWKDRSRYGLSLALGAGEVKMIDMAQAYSIFANLGEKVSINPIIEIDNYLGKVVYKKKIEEEKNMEKGYAYLINQILSDDEARSPVFGLNSKLKIKDRTVAVKTGTTNNLKDNWCIGWTPSYLVATWVGNNDATPMSWVASGVSGATPIWNRIMKEMINEKGDEKWDMPDGVIKSNACGREEYYIQGTEKNVKCPVRVTPTPTDPLFEFFN